MNGFFGATGSKALIPALYDVCWEHVYRRFSAKKNFSFLRYQQPGATFHAKGLWAEAEDFRLTIVGSSNFSRRSFERDFEAQLMIASNDAFRMRIIDEDLMRIRSGCSPASISSLSTSRRLLLQPLFRLVRGFL